MNTVERTEDLIGGTPIYILRHNGMEVLIKLEGQNPGGSVKDRIAKAMIDAAEENKDIGPGGIIIEPTSGNTGIGLAMVGVQRGYRVIIVMPETMSKERRQLIEGYGAELFLTKGEEGMKGAIDKAYNLLETLPNAFMPMQFDNPANIAVHENITAKEIMNATKGEFDIFVAGVGTGGTFTGVSRVLKRKAPHILCGAAEPAASPVLSGGKPAPHGIQGIGANFIPKNFDPSLADHIISVTDNDALETTRFLGQKRGLFVGISTGAAVWAAMELLRKTGKKRALCISPDRGEKYLSIM